jgi:hypothetical protein
MKVYVLEIELNGPSFDPSDVIGEYAGYTSVHATRISALRQLDTRLGELDIDPETAHLDQTMTETFIGNDVDPDLLDGDRLTWGINEMEVHA